MREQREGIERNCIELNLSSVKAHIFQSEQDFDYFMEVT